MKNKTAYFGVFTSLALILSYVETLIPISFGIPGIKLGLANLVIVIVLYTYGGKEAFLLSVTRILLSGFLFGNLSMILYSMAGGVFSLASWCCFVRPVVSVSRESASQEVYFITSGSCCSR